MKGLAPRLALRKRLKVIRKRPILSFSAALVVSKKTRLHIVPVEYNPMLQQVLESQHTTHALCIIADILIPVLMRHGLLGNANNTNTAYCLVQVNLSLSWSTISITPKLKSNHLAASFIGRKRRRDGNFFDFILLKNSWTFQYIE